MTKRRAATSARNSPIRTEVDFWAAATAPSAPTGCRLWLRSVDKDGYGRVAWRGRRTRAHRVAFEITEGRPVSDGLLLRHTCDTPGCIEPSHLIEGAVLDNAADMVARGRQSRRAGEANTQAVLTPEQVRAIRADGRGARELAAAFNVSRWTIWDIRSRRSWGHLE